MPLLDRDTLVDRPVLVNRGDEEEEQDDKDTEGTAGETLGQGGGPTLYGMEFEPGDYNIVAGANTAAVLSTGEQGGEAFEQSFVNAAIQLKDLVRQGEDVRDLARFGLEKGVAEIGLTRGQIETLRELPEEEEEPEPEPDNSEADEDEEGDEEDAEEEEDDEDDDGGAEIEEVEEDIEEVKEESDG